MDVPLCDNAPARSLPTKEPSATSLTVTVFFFSAQDDLMYSATPAPVTLPTTSETVYRLLILESSTARHRCGIAHPSSRRRSAAWTPGWVTTRYRSVGHSARTLLVCFNTSELVWIWLCLDASRSLDEASARLPARGPVATALTWTWRATPKGRSLIEQTQLRAVPGRWRLLGDAWLAMSMNG